MTQQSNTVPQIYAALNAAQLQIAKEGIGKDRTNQQQGYKFRGIDDVYNALSPIMAEHGLLVIPSYSHRVAEERRTKNGEPIWNVTVVGSFTVVSVKDGSSLDVGPFIGEAQDMADKATNKAMSAALKYCLFQTLLIPTKGDNDADAGGEAASSKPEFITSEQVAEVEALIEKSGVKAELFCKHFKLDGLTSIEKRDFDGAKKFLQKRIEKNAAKPEQGAANPEPEAAKPGANFEG